MEVSDRLDSGICEGLPYGSFGGVKGVKDTHNVEVVKCVESMEGVEGLKAKLWNRPSWDRVGIELMASQLNPNYYHPEPQPTTPRVLVDISTYSYLN